jgi:hypothetical protein
LEIFGRLSERIWIPHHVALEFQRNRWRVLADQERRFSDVKKIVQKARDSLVGELEKLQLRKRHSLIDPQPLMTGFDSLVETFLGELARLRRNCQSMSGPDPLKSRLEALIDGRVGAAPVVQQDVDKIYEDAARRFELGLPPGFKDSEKHKDESSTHHHRGILYRTMFADCLIWQQLLMHAKSIAQKEVVFVTADKKEDWWHVVNSEGAKILGARPELIEEAHEVGGIETFIMYTPESFLTHAREFLRAVVSEGTLKDVRDVSVAESGSRNEASAMSIIAEAMRQRSLLEFTYNGKLRVVAPYTLGVSASGIAVLRAVQVGGERASGGTIGPGKLWAVSRMANLRALESGFDPDRSQNQF